jgi:trans-aconitate methyltransferase
VQTWLALEVLDQIDFSGVRSALDVGSGNGRVTREISRRAPAACVLGVDASPDMVEYARKHYANEHLDFRQGDAADLKLESRFDLITSFACLHWLRDPAAAVARMARELLNPGGLLRVQMGGAGNMGTFVRGVETLRREPHWRVRFQDFSFPWTFWPLEPYEQALAGLPVERMELLERSLTIRKAEFKPWFQAGWRPYVLRLGPDLDAFLDELLDGQPDPMELRMVRVDLAVRGPG